MIKILIYSIALSFFIMSGWQFYESFGYKAKTEEWREAKAWVIEEGEGCTTKFVQFIMSQPFVGCVYLENNSVRYGEQKLPPSWPLCITNIYRNSKSKITKGILDPYSTTNTNQYARYNKEKRRVERITKEGMVMQTSVMGNFNETRLGQEWGEVYPQEFGQYLPTVNIKYNPHNTEEIITVPDDLMGDSVLLWSGVLSLGTAFFFVGAGIMHQSMTAETDPSEELARRL